MIGLCFILKYGSILNFIRKPLTKIKFFEELFKCALCLGFWVGCLFGLVLDGSFLLWCFYSSASCWAADHLIMLAQKKLYGADN
jgi:hypothetical protein